ncbi:hypothetical protein [Xenorhabdus griffiniae]|uniref:Uncharacterized protein n=1 Tax=Xenorhabdus griffiniae TaxID=351672 RepID=A0ABY9XKI9_9GAMM|nr:hypothetical protein [Xenorhabdus griffiniae]MBD1229572.1 hypothetical protein [Xenorhabdus griffiniae]WMV73337.1 hypothetical protein QL128_04690 [Xenorhabdus griffiniae]WNH03016.1 hypothetical protein QL112_004695 [Xenorhabdus griffiniae]
MNDEKTNEIKVSRLSTLCDPLLKEDIGILNKEQIENEGAIELINDKNCIIINEINSHRKSIIIPVLIGFLLGFVLFINDFIKTWEGNEKGYFRMVNYAKKIYGDDFYLNPKLPDNLRPYKYIADSKSISLLEYFYIRYMDNGFYEKSTVRGYLLLDGGFFLFFLTANVFLLYLLFFSYKLAPFVIDRKKKVFYTWAKGKMYIARYTQLEAVNSNGDLFFRTYGFDENNNLLIHTFKPRTPDIHNSRIGKAYLLAFMAKYLIQGKEAVSSVDFQRQRTLFASLFILRQEPKPIYWESQIEDILVELDKIMPPDTLQDEVISKESI